MSRLAAAALSALLISYAPPAAAQETRPDVSSSTRDAGAMPERRGEGSRQTFASA